MIVFTMELAWYINVSEMVSAYHHNRHNQVNVLHRKRFQVTQPDAKAPEVILFIFNNCWSVVLYLGQPHSTFPSVAGWEVLCCHDHIRGNGNDSSRLHHGLPCPTWDFLLSRNDSGWQGLHLVAHVWAVGGRSKCADQLEAKFNHTVPAI